MNKIKVSFTTIQNINLTEKIFLTHTHVIVVHLIKQITKYLVYINSKDIPVKQIMSLLVMTLKTLF